MSNDAAAKRQQQQTKVAHTRTSIGDQGAVALWDSCGKTAVSECVGYLERDTAALVRASIAAGDSVEVEYVGTKHRGSEGHPVVIGMVSTYSNWGPTESSCCWDHTPVPSRQEYIQTECIPP